MITLTTDYRRPVGSAMTQRYTDMDEALQAYLDKDYAACHQPGSDIKRITLRLDGTTIKTKTYA